MMGVKRGSNTYEGSKVNRWLQLCFMMKRVRLLAVERMNLLLVDNSVFIVHSRRLVMNQVRSSVMMVTMMMTHSIQVTIHRVFEDGGSTVNIVPPVTHPSLLVEEGSVWTEKLVVSPVRLTIVPGLREKNK